MWGPRRNPATGQTHPKYRQIPMPQGENLLLNLLNLLPITISHVNTAMSHESL